MTASDIKTCSANDIAAIVASSDHPHTTMQAKALYRAFWDNARVVMPTATFKVARRNSRQSSQVTAVESDVDNH